MRLSSVLLALVVLVFASSAHAQEAAPTPAPWRYVTVNVERPGFTVAARGAQETGWFWKCISPCVVLADPGSYVLLARKKQEQIVRIDAPPGSTVTIDRTDELPKGQTRGTGIALTAIGATAAGISAFGLFLGLAAENCGISDCESTRNESVPAALLVTGGIGVVVMTIGILLIKERPAAPARLALGPSGLRMQF